MRAALPELEGQGYFQLLDNVYRTGETFAGNEMPDMLKRHGDGPLDRRFMNLVYQALRDADGGISGIFVHGVNVTDLVRSREAVREGETFVRATLDSSAGGFYGVAVTGRRP